ncbi:flagellar hook capping protein [Tepidicaulis marinus]|uniref:Basal-body rod modification protein FlgD n=1 Tax=Tepidicaulis marinus TaxID=1333998 RepID=A0A081BEM1_9HYPH|nr:flagellar hook capping FlgD N-terminal domain-containing protein [Tepidicaulis marinus]GAK46489.1 flagellar hook capping protein [Tepidicaulis marinus]
MDILGSNPASVAAQAQQNLRAQSATASAALDTNFDTFLTLLTTQLRHQDPLNPLESNEFTQQLVQFSGVEQSIQTNRQLESLLAVAAATSSSQAVSYIGKEVDAVSNVAELKDGEASWIFGLAEEAETATLNILDANGATVYTKEISGATGAQDFVWDGKNNDGVDQPDGFYIIDIEATNEDGEQVQYSSRITGTVTGVDFSGNVPLINLGDQTIPASDVLAVRDKAQSQPPSGT